MTLHTTILVYLTIGYELLKGVLLILGILCCCKYLRQNRQPAGSKPQPEAEEGAE